MAYSNDQTQITAGLSNYVGALLKASPWEEKAAKEDVISVLTNQIYNLSLTDNEIDIDLFKPVIKLIVVFCNQRIKQLETLPKKIAQDNIQQYKNIINTLNYKE